MDSRSTGFRTIAHVLLALLFAVAAIAFGQDALDAWNAKRTGRLVLMVLATLGAVSLSAHSLRRARASAGVQAMRR